MTGNSILIIHTKRMAKFKEIFIREAKFYSRKIITTVVIVAAAGGAIYAMAAFVEPTVGPAASVQDFVQNIMGANNADNAFDSSSVVSNKDGSLIERDEYAQQQVGSTTGNQGMYSNQIVLMTPPAAYTEVCFKGGSTQYDAHASSASTAGGNCVPGDTGYIVEKNERTAAAWEAAKQTCLQYGMRLSEPFEWSLACKNAGTWSLTSMTGNYEWASNIAISNAAEGSIYGVSTTEAGAAGCDDFYGAKVGATNNTEDTKVFRCFR